MDQYLHKDYKNTKWKFYHKFKKKARLMEQS